jgi:hypothetical protein
MMAEKNVLPLFPIEAILKGSDETNEAQRLENAAFGQTRGACLPSVHFHLGVLFQSSPPVVTAKRGSALRGPEFAHPRNA